MTKGTAEEYWAATAEGHFEAMSSPYQPGERAESDPAPRQARRGLPPLTASQTIVDAIAACVPAAGVPAAPVPPRGGAEPTAAAHGKTVVQATVVPAV